MSQKFLITVLFLVAGSVLLSFLLVTALNGRGSVSLALWQRALIALAAAAVTAGNYTGFVLASMRYSEGTAVPKGVKILACVLFPVTVLLITLYGIVMLLPSIIKAVKRG